MTEDELRLRTLELKVLLERVHAFETGFQRLLHALRFAIQAHEGQYRRTGQPYVTHPIEVAALLRSRGANLNTIIAGLVHDVIEDTTVSFSELEHHVGPDVSEIINCYLRRIPNCEQALDLDGLQSRLAKSFENKAVAELRLCERLANVRHVEHMPVENRRYILDETVDIFVPVARGIGLDDLADDLEMMCLLQREGSTGRLRSYYFDLRQFPAPELASLVPKEFGDFLKSVSKFHAVIGLEREQEVDVSNTEIASRLERLEAALVENGAPSAKDLLGSIGPVDLKGLWTWAVYLTNYGSRSKELDGFMGHSDSSFQSAVESRDRETGGLADTLLARGLVDEDSTVCERIARAIRSLFTNPSRLS